MVYGIILIAEIAVLFMSLIFKVSMLAIKLMLRLVLFLFRKIRSLIHDENTLTTEEYEKLINSLQRQ